MKFSTHILVELYLPLEVFDHISLEVGRSVLVEVLHLGEDRVGDDVGSTLDGLKGGFCHFARVLLCFGRRVLNFSHGRLRVEKESREGNRQQLFTL